MAIRMSRILPKVPSPSASLLSQHNLSLHQQHLGHTRPFEAELPWMRRTLNVNPGLLNNAVPAQ